MEIENNYKIYLLWLFLLLVAIVASWQMWVAMAKKRIDKIMRTAKFINPTEKFRITSQFGQRTAPVAGASTNHNGIDIATPIGTPVVAPADGTVTLVNNVPNMGGKQIVITHNDGYKTGYAHLSEQLVSVGQNVKQGQLIAKTGNTGIGTGPHLHFTLTYNGVKIDPLKYFYK